MENKSILITGGTGSLGRSLARHIIKNFPSVRKVIIFSRDEQKQYRMSQEYPSEEFPQIKFIIGDVRDQDRLLMAFNDVDYVIHTAAMKHIPIAEYNPDECIKTNVGGARHVIKAAVETNVERVVALSTDKACAPVNLYGATKLTSDKLFIAANNIGRGNSARFSVVRYGNVLGSTGSVIPFFLKKRKEGVLPITDPNMTRFTITIEEGVELVMHALLHGMGGELFIPKISSFKITDLAEAICPECEKNIIGIRPGEKIHEQLITPSDSFYTYDLGKYYAILPQKPTFDLDSFIRKYDASKVEEGFHYSSRTNPDFETVESLRRLIQTHVDRSFGDESGASMHNVEVEQE